MSEGTLNAPRMRLGEKLLEVHWLFVLLLVATASVGIAMLYSGADGRLEPWAMRQSVRFAMGIAIMLAVAVTDIRVWLRYAYAIYGMAMALLVTVEFVGISGMGAQRWIDLGYVSLQPSEVMKIALVLALARYFHGGSLDDVKRPLFLVPPVLLVAAPAALVLRQPDLGTAIMLMLASAAIFFVAGVRLWKFGALALLALVSAPVVWHLLHDYQRRRILTFLDPESDPLGAGYHIIQSKIALGSGGLTGKGFMAGTQSHLNFLPEMQTDFIFTMLAEEFGLVGALGLLALYGLILVYCMAISLRCRNHFGRLVGMGVASTFFLYVFINIAMVMGLIPVVGIPLPLISYGGTALLTLMFGFGLVLGVYVHRDQLFGRRAAGEKL